MNFYWAIFVLTATLSITSAKYQLIRDHGGKNNRRGVIYFEDYNMEENDIFTIADRVFEIFDLYEDEPNRTLELLLAVNIDLDGYCPIVDRWNIFAVSTCETYFRFGNPNTKYFNFIYQANDNIDRRRYVIYNECN